MGKKRGRASRGEGVEPPVKTDFLMDLKEAHARQKLADLSRGFDRTIKHLDEVSRLGDVAYKHQKELFDAAKTGNDPKINKLAARKKNG